METILSVIAVCISVASGAFALYTFFWTARRDRKQATLEAFNRLQTEVFDYLNMYKPSEVSKICENTKSAEYKTIGAYLARIEHFCVGLNQGIYDKDTFYALAHGYFDGPMLQSRIIPIIHAKNHGNHTNDLFYNDTLAVVSWMKEKTKQKEKQSLQS